MNRKQMEQLACLIEEEKNNLYRYACYRLGDEAEAEDVLQEMFLALCGKEHLINNVENLRNYLYRTLTNQCGMNLRQRKKEPEKMKMEDWSQLQVQDTEPQNFEQEFLLIDHLLSTIPMEQSEVIRLHIHGERTFTDIASILDIPLSTAKARYHYGIEKLRNGLRMNKLIQ
ncbi:MAG: RNA polymerase sigma factor [Bacteroidaceae bacterium]|nr:RNA polymerase sigma factor [Bacteroidaceae bacterium]